MVAALEVAYSFVGYKPPTMTHPNPSHPDPISSHVLDTKSGMPAKGVTATLFVKRDMRDENSWQKVSTR